ncbi:hypothetical protein BT96DRAFT_923636 [Gymnopus androsaceus JB14]|uniref:Uncharacterized protein n=1 Tax=Gymnopus androsaceus JB14 TaxID=1447944 RepID=A0A6A4H920_9AGAR|nr:hypothetical protein BT96DRAFT_923636 [Gymnopus androsaceus JB14]
MSVAHRRLVLHDTPIMNDLSDVFGMFSEYSSVPSGRWPCRGNEEAYFSQRYQ